jgi:hypothetical protein
MASAKSPFAERENLPGIYPVHNVRHLSGSDPDEPLTPALSPQAGRGRDPAQREGDGHRVPRLAFVPRENPEPDSRGLVSGIRASPRYGRRRL